MKNKKIIVIPPLSNFENTLGIQDRKIKGAVFVPNKSNYANFSSLESTLNELKFIDLFGLQMKKDSKEAVIGLKKYLTYIQKRD